MPTRLAEKPDSVARHTLPLDGDDAGRCREAWDIVMVDRLANDVAARQARNRRSSGLISSARVHVMPWEPPLISTYLTFLIILACRLDVASGGRMRSSSPWMIMVGRSLPAMSLRKSSIQASTQATVPIGDARIATAQFASMTRSLTRFPSAPPTL